MFNITLPKNTRRIFIAVLISLACILSSYFKVFETFELATMDLRFKLRPPQRVTDRVVIIEIAQDTLNQIGEWPIDRGFYGALIDILSLYEAKAIIFDMLFSQPTSSDSQFIDSVKNSNRVYGACVLRLSDAEKKGLFPGATEYETQPLAEFTRGAKGIGHINIIPDIDGKRRKIPLFIDLNGELIPQMSFLAACDYLNVRLEDIKIPIDSSGQTLINFVGKWGKDFRHYSFIDILKSYVAKQQQKTPLIDLIQFRNKICVVGLTAVATHDLNPIPLQERYPMVGLHANLINMILCRNFIVRADPLINILILILISLIVILAVLRFRPAVTNLTVLGIFFGFIILSFLLFGFLNIWIDLFYPLVLVLAVYIISTVYKYISERNRRLIMERELDIARSIQRSFLKESPPQIEGIDMAVIMSPARQVGGDLYDFVQIDGDSVGIMIGDVSGKGVPAALFMAKIVSDFRFHAKTKKDPLDVIADLNNQISTESSSGLFVTLSYLVADAKAKRLTIVDAGHLPIIHSGKDKDASAITSESGMALGIMEGVEFKKKEISVKSDDIFLLYTDGVTEARNIRKEEFSEKRLKDLVFAHKRLDASGIAAKLYDELTRFMQRAPQHDDITIIVLKIK